MTFAVDLHHIGILDSLGMVINTRDGPYPIVRHWIHSVVALKQILYRRRVAMPTDASRQQLPAAIFLAPQRSLRHASVARKPSQSVVDMMEI